MAYFARTGMPRADDLPAWPACDESERRTMIFDEAPAVAADPGSDVRRYRVGG
jgi:carboxylesterase type B